MSKYVGSDDKNGKMDVLYPVIGQSNPKLIRIGGIDWDMTDPLTIQTFQYPASTNYYINMINQIRNNGAEPVVQIPVWNESFTEKYTPAQAAALVHFLNDPPNNLAITHFAIGNEPDGQYFNAIGNYKADEIEDYIKAFSVQIRNAAAPLPVTIYGAELRENDFTSLLLI